MVGERLYREVFPVSEAVERRLAAESRSVDQREKTKQFEDGVNIVTFDVGGGSLDTSLLHARFRDSEVDEKRLIIEERYNETSTEFCGRSFPR